MDQSIAELFELAFDDEDIVVELADEELLFTNQPIGYLRISSGQIIAGDPARASDTLQLSETFPNGEFLTEVAIAEFEDGEEIAGYFRIKFSNNAPQHWESATYSGENAHASTLVESGIFVLADANVLSDLPAIDGEEREAVMNKLNNALDETYEDDRAWAELDLESGNLVACSSGDGAGTYTTYIGRDASGKICRLLVDFALFEEDE
ncbi:DUF4241 domain-containing protein [Tunicatimonas pelagia]|uniref:DUF4241 domain-containing protein n=1 Tax=Tunicatimonas pelagia TaxID=931531 RepID=UPI0026661185|nr:DUF4241 domain-containing protein [Tunicatimonas pelagia]WKN40613.1 DUF4241 domain-containing protein [Tunicatimonas pelagia]